MEEKGELMHIRKKNFTHINMEFMKFLLSFLVLQYIKTSTRYVLLPYNPAIPLLGIHTWRKPELKETHVPL